MVASRLASKPALFVWECLILVRTPAEIPRVWDLNHGLVVGTSQVPETGDGHLRQPPADPGNYRNPIYAILSVCVLADRKRKVASRAAVPPRLAHVCRTGRYVIVNNGA